MTLVFVVCFLFLGGGAVEYNRDRGIAPSVGDKNSIGDKNSSICSITYKPAGPNFENTFYVKVTSQSRGSHILSASKGTFTSSRDKLQGCNSKQCLSYWTSSPQEYMWKAPTPLSEATFEALCTFENDIHYAFLPIRMDAFDTIPKVNPTEEVAHKDVPTGKPNATDPVGTVHGRKLQDQLTDCSPDGTRADATVILPWPSPSTPPTTLRLDAFRNTKFSVSGRTQLIWQLNNLPPISGPSLVTSFSQLGSARLLVTDVTNSDTRTFLFSIRSRRKEIRTLCPDELRRFLRAVRMLKDQGRGSPHPQRPDTIPAYARPNGWSPTSAFQNHTAFVVHHMLATLNFTGDKAHRGPSSIVWHSLFLVEYERALQSIDSSVSLPYWDFTADSQDFSSSPIFTDKYYGDVRSKSQPQDFTVATGSLAPWSTPSLQSPDANLLQFCQKQTRGRCVNQYNLLAESGVLPVTSATQNLYLERLTGLAGVDPTADAAIAAKVATLSKCASPGADCLIGMVLGNCQQQGGPQGPTLTCVPPAGASYPATNPPANSPASFLGTRSQMDECVGQDTYYNLFYCIIFKNRGLHDEAHAFLGGRYFQNGQQVLPGMAAPGSSTNDPVFFVFHAMIDRMYWRWARGANPALFTPSDPCGGFVPSGLPPYPPFTGHNINDVLLPPFYTLSPSPTTITQACAFLNPSNAPFFYDDDQ